MKFFVQELNQQVEYPDTQEALFKKIKRDATNRDSKKIACAYFNDYFSNGGGRAHPLLGDLEELRESMQSNWDFVLHGVNSVAATLEIGLSNLDKIHPVRFN